MKKALIFLFFLVAPICLLAQGVSVGKTQEQIRNMVKSNPAFTLNPGESTDTLIFHNDMQTVFHYKDKICVRTNSTMPLEYLHYMVDKMTEDGYVKIKENVWLSTHKTLRVEVTLTANKGPAMVETTLNDETPSKE